MSSGEGVPPARITLGKKGVSPLMLAPTTPNGLEHAIPYEYDSYGCDGCYGCDSNDDYCRGSRYEGLRLETVDSGTVLAYLLHCKYSDLTESALLFADEVGLDEVSNYEIGGDFNYYGEDVVISLNSNVFDDVEEWFYSHRDANDVSGILAYARAKGVPTAGLSPVEALNFQLKAEYKNDSEFELKSSGAVDYAFTYEIRPDKVFIPDAERFENSPAAVLESKVGGAPLVGVVKTDSYGRYVLLDGYRRMKGLKDSGLFSKPAVFIVLQKAN